MLKKVRKYKYLYTTLKYNWSLYSARKYFQEYDYCENLLFISGLPKSGTSWLESMLAEYPGFIKNMIPEAIKFEQKNKGSHFLELQKEWFEKLDKSLTVLKLHNYGSPNNAGVLEDLNIPYVVIFRDLRDVAVSHYFYVRNTWHHPEYEDYKDLSIEEGLKHFANTLLPDFKEWINSWRKNVDSELSLVIRYEDLNDNTYDVFKKVVEHYSLPSDKETLEKIIKKNSFEKLTGGRNEGDENSSSFYRKGVSGDWKNYFDDEITQLFKEEIGQLLIDVGYEEDFNW